MAIQTDRRGRCQDLSKADKEKIAQAIEKLEAGGRPWWKASGSDGKMVENGPFADDLRIKSGSFSIAMLVYQRVLMVIGDYGSNSFGKPMETVFVNRLA